MLIWFSWFFSCIGILGALYLLSKTYSWLWHLLFNLAYTAPKHREQQLLMKISLLLSTAFLVIILIFAIIYIFLTINPGQLIVHQSTGVPANWYQLNIFFYFSTVTYFSLGYGDYVPVGTAMQFIILIQSMLAYINSGLIVAYGFDIFRKYLKKES